MSQKPKDYESTVMRIAGNLLSGVVHHGNFANMTTAMLAEWAVELARAIVAETHRTRPVTVFGDTEETK